MSIGIGIVAALALMALDTPAAADGIDPHVGDEGGGSFVGIHTAAANGKSSDKGKNTRGESTSALDSGGNDSPRLEQPEPDPNCDLGPAAPNPVPRNCPREPLQPDAEPPDPEPLDSTTAEQYARQLIVRLQLPDPTPQFGPDPAVNEWNMAAVGYPLWLWTEGPRTLTSTESAYGLTFTLQAHYRSTTFTMGDGHTKQCTNTTPYRRSVKPGTPSPTCGYTYLNPAPGDGSYTVTATTHWDIDWSVAGFSGTLPGTHTASRSLPVGELQAIVVK